MYEDALEVLIPLVEVGAYLVAAALFTGIGFLLEYKSYLLLSGGEQVVGLWAVIVGLIALRAAYQLTNDKLLTAVGLRG